MLGDKNSKLKIQITNKFQISKIKSQTLALLANKDQNYARLSL
jgi:hypothetical protein